MSGLYWSEDKLENGSAAFNFSLSCLATNIQNPEELSYSSALLLPIRILQAVIYFILFVSGTLLNLLIVALITKYRKLQNHSFGIAFQIAALNVLLSILYLGGFISSIADRWVLGEYICVSTAMLLFVITDVRTLLMFVFVIDRFLFVFLPFSYPKYHRKVVIGLLSAIWVFAIATSIPPIILDCYTYHSLSHLCSTFSDCGEDCSYFSAVNYTLIAIPATVVPTVLYVILFIKAWKLRKAMPSIPKGARREGEREWKATITFAILFFSLFAVTLPSITINFIINRVYADTEAHPVVYVIAVASTSLLSVVPLTDAIVILRNRDVREVLQEARKQAIQMWRGRRAESNSKEVKKVVIQNV